LGYKWQEHNGRWLKTNWLEERRPPQILFAERCLQFLKPAGRLGIVLPESLFSNPSHRYVVTSLQEKKAGGGRGIS
jgi:type I restriction enzyme M protein